MNLSLKLKSTGLIVLVLVFTLFTVTCRHASEKTGEKLMEKALENATGNKADVDINNQKATIKTNAGSIEVDSEAKS